MKIIPLSGKYGEGLSVIVDDDMYSLLSERIWHARGSKTRKYACTRNNSNGLYMHSAIAGYSKWHKDNRYEVDHINGNSLDNRKINLRLVRRSQNHMNRRPNSRTGYKGVYQNTESRRYHASVFVDGKKIRIGNFDSAKEAAIAYNEAVKNYYGEYGYLNVID